MWNMRVAFGVHGTPVLQSHPSVMGVGRNSASASAAGTEINGVFVSLSLCLSSCWGGQEKGRVTITHVNGGEIEGS